MGKINVLGFDIANMIAAGEVVERPSSVLKELIENAIDSGADRIVAEIKHGGVSLIRVTDNGCGMEKDDLPVSIKRHATSKIRTREDLEHILTLGFRGEALAAISSVSHMTIISKTKESDTGHMLVAEGGNVVDLSEVGTSDGTTVVVENLFYNTPARKKFLKKDSTEALNVAALVEKVALSRPDISVQLLIDGEERFRTPGDGDLLHTIRSVYGREFASKMIAAEGAVGDIRVKGYIGRSDNAKKNRNMENFFINGRYVKSQTAVAAVERAYTSYMAPESFPVCVLMLNIRPDTVDVNVHPAKLEVKFSDERAVFEAVYYTVKNALESAQYRPEMKIGSRSDRNPLGAFVPAGENTRGVQIGLTPDRTQSADEARRAGNMFSGLSERDGTSAFSGFSGRDKAPAGSERSGGRRDLWERDTLPGYLRPSAPAKDAGREESAFPASGARRTDPLSPSAPGGAVSAETGHSSFAENDSRREAAHSASDERAFRTDGTLRVASTAAARGGEMTPKESLSLLETYKKAEPAPDAAVVGGSVEAKPYRFVGEAFDTYLFVEYEGDLLVIDKHAAHERVIFEDLKRRQQSDGRVGSQILLLPLLVTLTPQETGALGSFSSDLSAVGFDFSINGNVAEVTAIPDAIELADAEALFVRMLDELADGCGNPAVTEAVRRERALYQVACKAAIKGGRVYDRSVLEWLIAKLLALPDIVVCPHGRPVAYKLTKRELDKQFDRIK